MSFGFSIGDFIALGQLAWRVVGNTRKACGVHDDLTQEAIHLHLILKRLNEEVHAPNSLLGKLNDGREKELNVILTGCRERLSKLDKLLVKYNGLSDDTRPTKLWRKMQFGNKEVEDISDVRRDMARYTAVITLFLRIISMRSQGRVEEHMENHRAELRNMKSSINWITASLQVSNGREGSILTSYAEDDKQIWKEFRRGLVKEGFSSDVLRKHMPLIKNYVLELGARGLLDQSEDENYEELIGPFELDAETSPVEVSATPKFSLELDPESHVSSIELPACGLTQELEARDDPIESDSSEDASLDSAIATPVERHSSFSATTENGSQLEQPFMGIRELESSPRSAADHKTSLLRASLEDDSNNYPAARDIHDYTAKSAGVEVPKDPGFKEPRQITIAETNEAGSSNSTQTKFPEKAPHPADHRRIGESTIQHVTKKAVQSEHLTSEDQNKHIKPSNQHAQDTGDLDSVNGELDCAISILDQKLANLIHHIDVEGEPADSQKPLLKARQELDNISTHTEIAEESTTTALDVTHMQSQILLPTPGQRNTRNLLADATELPVGSNATSNLDNVEAIGSSTQGLGVSQRSAKTLTRIGSPKQDSSSLSVLSRQMSSTIKSDASRRQSPQDSNIERQSIDLVAFLRDSERARKERRRQQEIVSQIAGNESTQIQVEDTTTASRLPQIHVGQVNALTDTSHDELLQRQLQHHQVNDLNTNNDERLAYEELLRGLQELEDEKIARTLQQRQRENNNSESEEESQSEQEESQEPLPSEDAGEMMLQDLQYRADADLALCVQELEGEATSESEEEIEEVRRRRMRRRRRPRQDETMQRQSQAHGDEALARRLQRRERRRYDSE